MLPKSVETPRLKVLQEIAANAAASDLAGWPMLKEKDYVLIGGIVVLFSYIDLDLRRIVEAADFAGALKAPWNGKTANLTAADVEKVVLSLPDWSPPNEYALNQIREMRSARNLFAHFAVRRFPNDDAFIFIAKSARDFKRQFGTDPEPGAVMTAVSEVDQVKGVLKHIESLHTWLSKMTPTIEEMFVPRSKPGHAIST
jgi:hypothetical protein